VTICTKDRKCVLGEIVEESAVLSPAGLIVEEERPGRLYKEGMTLILGPQLTFLLTILKP